MDRTRATSSSAIAARSPGALPAQWNSIASPKPLGHPCRDPAFVYSTESESQQARTQQHQACRGQCEESVRDNVVVAHDTPTTPDARPNLLKLSKFPIGTTESFAQLEFGRTPEPLAVQAHALER